MDVELINPLQLELAISHLRLACNFEPAAASSSSGPAGSPGFQVHEESITLRPEERLVCHLRVMPLEPGRLSLDGVAWTLGGAAQGQERFRIPRPRPHKPGSSMCDDELACVGGLNRVCCS